MFMFISYLVMAPIFAGWILLFTWPMFFLLQVMIYGIVANFKSKQVIKRNLQFIRDRLIQKMLNQQTLIPWGQTYSSLDLSYGSSVVQNWLIEKGVQEHNSLSHFVEFKNSISFPDAYDLVTDLVDSKNRQNLDNQYEVAAKYLRSGGIFINLEEETKTHSLLSHLISAHRSGLSLLSRSDRAISSESLVSKDIWAAHINASLKPVMMAWSKA